MTGPVRGRAERRARRRAQLRAEARAGSLRPDPLVRERAARRGIECVRVEPDDYPARWTLTLPDGPAEPAWCGTGPWELVPSGGFGAVEYAEHDDDDEALDWGHYPTD